MITKEIWEALDLICGFRVVSLITEERYEGGWYPDEIIALSEVPKVIRHGEEDYMQNLETSNDCERAVVTTQVLKKEFEDLGLDNYDYINMVILRND